MLPTALLPVFNIIRTCAAGFLLATPENVPRPVLWRARRQRGPHHACHQPGGDGLRHEDAVHRRRQWRVSMTRDSTLCVSRVREQQKREQFFVFFKDVAQSTPHHLALLIVFPHLSLQLRSDIYQHSLNLRRAAVNASTPHTLTGLGE